MTTTSKENVLKLFDVLEVSENYPLEEIAQIARYIRELQGFKFTKQAGNYIAANPYGEIVFNHDDELQMIENLMGYNWFVNTQNALDEFGGTPIQANFDDRGWQISSKGKSVKTMVLPYGLWRIAIELDLIQPPQDSSTHK